MHNLDSNVHQVAAAQDDPHRPLTDPAREEPSNFISDDEEKGNAGGFWRKQLLADGDPQLNATRAGVLAVILLAVALGPTGNALDLVDDHEVHNGFVLGVYVGAALAVIGQLYWSAKAALLCGTLSVVAGVIVGLIFKHV